MTEALVALLAFIGAVFGAWLVYLSTRKRDVPTIEMEREKGQVASALAIGEAWAEYADTMEHQLDKVKAEQESMRMELVEARSLLAKALHNWEMAGNRIRELEAELTQFRALHVEEAT